MNKKSGLVIGLVSAAVIGAAYLFGLFGMAEYQGLDLLFRARGPRPVNPNIVVIEIDDTALKDFGRWPWPRGYHAELLDIIAKFKPKVIAFDILFSEPQAEHPEEDKKLVLQSKRAGNVFYASFFDLKANSATFPIPELSEKSRGCGFVNIAVEPDGKVRRTPLFITHKGKRYPSLDLITAAYFLGKNPEEMRIPADKDAMMWINYAGRFERFYRIPFSAVAVSGVQMEKGEKPYVDLNILKNKIVIVGLTATGSEDYWSTSVSALYPGIGIRTSSINTILQGDFIRRIFGVPVFVILIILGAGLGIVVPKRNPHQGLIFFLILASGVLATAITAFGFFNVWLDFVTPLILLSVAYPALTLNQFIVTRFEKGLIEKELQIASRIQQSILPQTMPRIEGVELGVKCVPAKHVGGDFYDFIRLLYDFVELKEDRFGIVIGDVSGKGVPAALFMAKAMADFRGLSHNHKEPSHALAALNERLVEEGISGMFVTLQYLIYNPKEKKIKYSNGGHNPLLWIKSTGNAASLTQSVGSPIGIIPGSEFISDEFAVSTGDLFVMYTDGISEARDKNRKEFGEKRILDAALMNRNLPAQRLADRLVEETEKFSQGMPQHDDMTVIVLKIT